MKRDGIRARWQRREQKDDQNSSAFHDRIIPDYLFAARQNSPMLYPMARLTQYSIHTTSKTTNSLVEGNSSAFQWQVAHSIGTLRLSGVTMRPTIPSA